MERLGFGRTSQVYRIADGIVFKAPWRTADECFAKEIENAFSVEKKLLQLLGSHTGIIKFCGRYRMKGFGEGLLLREANFGDLQTYLDNDDGQTSDIVRKTWIIQVAEAVAYVHSKGILHMNLSTNNVLLHREDGAINAIIADFGGSKCCDLGLIGGLLPDPVYLDPHLLKFDIPQVDIFSLGIVIYIIATGHYPFCGRSAPESENVWAYQNSIGYRYKAGEFPDLAGVLCGEIIAGCCCERRFKTASEVVRALRAAN